MARAIEGLTTAVALLTLLATAATRRASAGEDERSRLPAAVVKAIEGNRPGARIAKLDVEHEEGVTFYDIEFKSGEGEMDVAEDGTVLDVATVIEMKDVPAPAADVIKKAATGTTIKQLTRSEIRARIEKVAGKGRVSPLSTPEYVYEAELKRGGEVEVGGDGRILKAPKSLREAVPLK
jgi:hypothetical protein